MLYSRLQTAEIARAWTEAEDPVCPDCKIPLSPHSVPPRHDVAYVRHRVLLFCQKCRRNATVEARQRGSRSAAERPESIPPLLGWKEWVALDGSPAFLMEAKVDSGARTSALHAEDVEIFDEGGTQRARFHIWHRSGLAIAEEARASIEAPVVDERIIRSSSGDEELRPVVVLPMTIAGVSFSAEVTLTRRDAMQFRMLLGRTSLRRRFWVDAGGEHLGGVPFAPDQSTDSPSDSTP